MNLDLEIYYTTDLPPLLITSKWVRFVRVCGNSQKLCRASCKVRVIKSVLCKRLTDEIHSADYGIFHLGNPLRHHFNEIILEHSPYLRCIVKNYYMHEYSLILFETPPLILISSAYKSLIGLLQKVKGQTVILDIVGLEKCKQGSKKLPFSLTSWVSVNHTIKASSQQLIVIFKSHSQAASQ